MFPGYLFNSLFSLIVYSMEYIYSFYNAIFVNNPLLLLFVVLSLVGLGIGLIKRVIN